MSDPRPIAPNSIYAAAVGAQSGSHGLLPLARDSRPAAGVETRTVVRANRKSARYVEPIPTPMTALSQDSNQALASVLQQMGVIYRENAELAVRGQTFIKLLHEYLGEQLDARLTPAAKRHGVRIVYEAPILGSHKPKNVDVSVIDPDNGPLLMLGLRSQMSSVGKNAPNYYEGIIGECISLQDRFPMSVHGYLYLMPKKPIKAGREEEVIDHARYAKWYGAITGREGVDYARIRGIYDQFAYMVVDFSKKSPSIDDALVLRAVPDMDLTVGTLVDRLVRTFAKRMLFRDIFAVPATHPGR